jgi:hypothetical protein
MRPDEHGRLPVSDPAASGLPDYADDDATADVDLESGREADGPRPAPLPPDREDGPLALDEFGTTAEEQRLGETLAGRLSREEPDIDPDEAGAAEGPDDEEPVDPALDSPVSVYERLGPDPVTGGRVGRLVQPDEGAHEDTESSEVAYDAGLSGGGLSAEEAAVNEIPDATWAD